MTEHRPAIPADLRRRVLLEAGHRCAIPTCLYPEIDVHHIVPWIDCLEHRFENLLALCPNCHRRADRGDIDRKSLLLYKARLSALFGPELLTLAKPKGEARVWINSSRGDHRTLVLSLEDAEANYAVEVEHPQFNSARHAALDNLTRDAVDAQANDVATAARDPQRVSAVRYSLVGAYNVALYTPLVVSIRFSFSSYTGGAHHSHWTEVVNYRIDRGTLFGVRDLFEVPELGVKALSDYAVESLLSTDDIRRDEAYVKTGAGPDPNNFSKFNLGTEGISVVFDEYQIGCFAEGKAEVLVPYSVVRPLLSEFIDQLIKRHGGVDAQQGAVPKGSRTRPCT